MLVSKLRQYFRLKKFNDVKVKNGYVNKRTYFEGHNSINKYSKISNCYLGMYSYIGTNCYIRNTKIGRYCSLGNNIKVILGRHPTNFISTHDFCFKDLGTFIADKKVINSDYSVIIENDVWIGDNVLILPGVTIHTGAIIGAGALVNSDIPAYAIVGGVPAKLIRYRFSDDIVKKLLDSKWWDYSVEELNKYSIFFNNPEKYLKNMIEL